jgi:hypothetical protein
MVEQMEERARLHLAEEAHAKAQALITELHQGKHVTVHARLLRSGKQIYGYRYDGIRLERSTLLQLLCTETDCPQCQQTQANWKRFQGVPAPVPRPARQDYQFKHLAEEVPISANGRTVFARPAVFQCKTICPIKAHPNATVRKTGWDLFDRGVCIGGGLTTNPETQMLVPLLPTIDIAKSWLSQQPTSQDGDVISEMSSSYCMG